jgi:RNA-directed DNA polymerase
VKDWRSHANLASRGIAEKAARDKTHRFRNLFGMLTPAFLTECWSRLNRRAAPGVDRVTAWEYGRALQQNIAALVERVRQGRYRAKLVLTAVHSQGGGKTTPVGIAGHGRQTA